jgi:hypothetical protein
MTRSRKLTILSTSALALIAAVAFAATPFRQSVTVALGVGTTTLARDYVGTTVTHVQCAGTNASVISVQIVVGTTTNTIGAKILAANDTIAVITNAYPLFKGDTIRITSTDLGTNTFYVAGETTP